MIYRLQRRFVLISTVSVFAVIALVFALITVFNIYSMNTNLDKLTDSISAGGGRFPDSFMGGPPPKQDAVRDDHGFDFITSETPFSTRHFTVWYGQDGEVVRVNTEFIHSITEETAVEYAEDVIGSSRERGWISRYRYKIFSTENGKAVVFIDGSTSRSAMLQSVAISAFVLLGCGALVLLLIILLSKRMVKPIAESYEKQRQFVTDANHELKTPLTLILANVDIAEAELGKNEWLEDIRAEGHRMTELVNQLVALSRMDEAGHKTEDVRLSLSDIVSDTVSEFKGLADSRGKSLRANVEEGINYFGDEVMLRRLTSILLDNAVKYCDAEGEISVTLKKKRHIALTVENTYRDVDKTELDRLFDRFYRADKARKYTGGYGVGLSIAKAITERHRGEITAYKAGDGIIGFKAVLRTKS